MGQGRKQYSEDRGNQNKSSFPRSAHGGCWCQNNLTGALILAIRKILWAVWKAHYCKIFSLSVQMLAMDEKYFILWSLYFSKTRAIYFPTAVVWAQQYKKEAACGSLLHIKRGAPCKPLEIKSFQFLTINLVSKRLLQKYFDRSWLIEGYSQTPSSGIP